MGRDERPKSSAERSLGDFTITPEVWRLIPLAIAVGALSAVVALLLLDLIGFFTQLAYYGRIGLRVVPPTLSHFGAITIVIPVVGGLIVGLMARYGSEQIRGHGIPEAMETILVGGSRVKPRLVLLKPISSAVSIGAGGPFGAEGPIILTGGAVGSVLAQLFHLSAIERRALLVAGACGGMAAVFGTPVAAALFGIELLVFELKPRSMVPIGISVVVAESIRDVFARLGLIKGAPLFLVPAHGTFSSMGVAEAAAIGIAGALLAWVLTKAVYGAEDAFKKLPIHWAWWPAIGGLVVGLGGLVDPKALGVGYAVIGNELAGQIALGGLVLLLGVKLVIWAVALGSGTSGGIIAPLLMMGAALGGILASVLPGGTEASWALMGMAATMSGVTRSPFTSVIFAFELTHDTGSLLPLLTACTVAHLISSLILKRSILTEKVARRGFHVLREYSVDPLEALFVREAMMTNVLTVKADRPASELHDLLERNPVERRQRLYPAIDDSQEMIGVVGWSDVLEALASEGCDPPLGQLMHTDIVSAFPDETLRSAADRMAMHKVGVLPVVERQDSGHLRGILTQYDLLQARERQLEEERHRERILRVRAIRARPTAHGSGRRLKGQ
ncbi:MAG: chloride channel protein [Acidimicrobiales bacterium]|nr:MAG: chloride channel protein [Acidimicrobiales bacterium]